jgi:hypothetical protein
MKEGRRNNELSPPAPHHFILHRACSWGPQEKEEHFNDGLMVLLLPLLVSNDRSSSNDFSDAEASEQLHTDDESTGHVAVGPGIGLGQLLAPQLAGLTLQSRHTSKQADKRMAQ